MEVERVFRVNFLAAYATMRAVLPGMAERRRGAIVNIASDQALIGKQVSAAYGASKAAIAQLSRSAALDWARAGFSPAKSRKTLRKIIKTLRIYAAAGPFLGNLSLVATCKNY